MQIALDQIDFAPLGFLANRAPDAALIDSVRTQGVLQPVLLRPVGNRYECVKGERRVRAARAAGLSEVPATVEASLVGPHALAAWLAATLARRSLTTVERWRAITALVDQGMDAGTSAISVGLEPRMAKQMERLGRLHPDLLDLYAAEEAADEFDMPDWSDLGIIAAAPQDDQIKAARGCGFPDNLDWESLADALRRKRQRIPRAWAIFDPAEMAWDEDLFAEPAADDQFTSGDVDGFLTLQRAALAELIAKSKGRIRAPEPAWLKLPYWVNPPGWRIDANGTGRPETLAKNDKRTVFVHLHEDGGSLGGIRWMIMSPVAAPNLAPTTAAEANDPADDDAHSDADEDAAPNPTSQPEPAPADPSLPLTKAGQALLAEARTTALRAALRAPVRTYGPDDLMAMLLIALSARTVTVKRDHGAYASTVDMRDLAAQLIGPDGQLRTDGADLGRLAQEALARMVSLPKPDDQRHGYANGYADPVPEWLGAFVGATKHLPRLDTEPFLAQVTGTELKAWAKSQGIKLTKVAEIRTRMTGRAEDWRPTFTHFGAPGPKPAKEAA